MTKKITFTFNISYLLAIVYILFSLYASPQLAKAQDKVNVWDKMKGNMDNAATQAGYPQSQVGKLDGDKTYLEEIIFKTIKIALSFTGIIFLTLTIYGGYLWMMSSGNEEQIEKAKNMVINSSIGLFLILAAYIITYTISTLIIGTAGV